MRLTKIKLSGFKTFVDPTTVLLPGRLVGVVGPNGCGKSNIIDATRWVLGESRAGALRGDSMRDVIFNGSDTRKQVGRASVELVFDNHAGRIGGPWAAYGELAVKRVLERQSGESHYSINQLPVRRRDVVDLFLGTGLGPRAYAIIEQGMISRLIEAKPQDLRLYLEEAAGVSKYRERRRETEGRLEDARDNMRRVGDICQELGTRVEQLAVQAEVASRYQTLRARLRRCQGLLWLKKRDAAAAAHQAQAAALAAIDQEIVASQTALAHAHDSVEAARAAHGRAEAGLQAAQAEMYAANADVARLEAERAHQRDAMARAEARLAQLVADEANWQRKIESLAADGSRWQALHEQAERRVGELRALHHASQQALAAAEATHRNCDTAVSAVRIALTQAEQQLRVEEAHRANAARTLAALAERRQRLESERVALVPPDAAILGNAESRAAELRARLAELDGHIIDLQEQLPALRAALAHAREAENVEQKRAAEVRARRDALQQLQNKTARDGKLDGWIERLGLSAPSPLWAELDVDSGWETAVEAALRERFTALPVEDDEGLARALAAPAPEPVALVVLDHPTGDHPPGRNDESLLAHVRTRDVRWQTVLADWLSAVRATEDLAALLARRNELESGTCWVDRRGDLIDRHGLRLFVPDARTHGAVERQRELGALAESLAVAEVTAAAAHAERVAVERQLVESEDTLTQDRRRLHELQKSVHGADLELLKARQEQARYQERRAQLEQALDEIRLAEQKETARGLQSETELDAMRARTEALRAEMNGQLESLRAADGELRATRAAEQSHARASQEAEFSLRECTSKLQDLAKARDEAIDQGRRVADALAALGIERQQIDVDGTDRELARAHTLAAEREQVLAVCRGASEESAVALRDADEQRLVCERRLAALRERAGNQRLAAQAAEMAYAQFVERLAEDGADASALIEAPEATMNEAVLANEIAKIGRAIDGLGAVNLAALQELDAARTRKTYLDAQAADLERAIQTLENAIRRIDRDTRAQLREVFERVNTAFGRLFPELFGGGQAALIMTGEEILDAGVQVVAQPPGKRNASIQLLSGGEKALTAIALVFAMFQLNPAPFCLLDEVDAPLDDSNTERFCQMVRRMSAETQFVFISHNKITMEMAEQLIGVTMQERGVSRVVEVDIDMALRLRDQQAA
ncbi:MAG: Chromosome partition protein Smc [Rhodocyclaceae bacterium]|nr:Chromosome partition protein Smc [Rhodocyclaceae bacterium]